jgi:hypothetical protein
MAREQYDDRRQRMLERIRMDVETSSAVPWLSAASTLRDRLIIGEDETHFLARMLTQDWLFSNLDSIPELRRLADEIDAVGKAHGLRPGEGFAPDEGPAEWHTLWEAWRGRADQMMATLMREGGLADVAETFLDRRAAFDKRDDEGRRRLWGPDEDDDLA